MNASPPRVSWPLVLALWLVGLSLTGATVGRALGHVNDFSQDYLAALALREGRSLYVPFTDAEVRAATQTSRWPLDLSGFILQDRPNYHPPICAVLFLPFTLIPFDVAFVLWSLLNVGLALCCTWLLLRELPDAFPTPWPRLFCTLPLLWLPFLDNYGEGQWGIIVMTGLVGGWGLLHHGRPFLAGSAVALAAMVKVFPAVFLLYFLVRRQWWATVGFLMTVLVGASLVTWAAGTGQIREYLERVGPECEVRYGSSNYNLSLNGIYRRLASDSLDPTTRKAGSMAVAGLGLGLAALWLSRFPATRVGEDRAYALMVMAMLLCSPITWQHSLVVLILPLAVLWSQNLDWRSRWWCLGNLVLYAVSVVHVMNPAIQRHHPQNPPFVETWPLLPFTFGLLALAGLLVWRPFHTSTPTNLSGVDL